jgi:hypothetical protein
MCAASPTPGAETQRHTRTSLAARAVRKIGLNDEVSGGHMNV